MMPLFPHDDPSRDTLLIEPIAETPEIDKHARAFIAECAKDAADERYLLATIYGDQA